MNTKTGRYINGKLNINERADFTKALEEINGELFEITIKPFKKRSLQANAYYWGCVVQPIKKRLAELGHFCTLMTTHEFLKARFNTVEFVTEEGEVLNFPQSTASQKTSEFWEYIEKCVIFASQSLDISIEPPGEQVSIVYSTEDMQ